MPSSIPPIDPFNNLSISQTKAPSKDDRSPALSASQKLPLHENIAALEIDNGEVDNLIRTIDTLTNAEDIQTLEQITTKLEKEIEQLNIYLTSNNIPSAEAEFAEDLVNKFIQGQGINKLASKVIKVGAKGLSISDDRLDNYQNNTELLSLAATILSELVDLSHLLQKNSLLTTQKEQLQKLKEESPQDLRKIELAERAVNELENETNKLNKGFLINTVLSAPDLADDIYGAVQIITNRAEILGVSAGLGIGSGVAAIISAAYRLVQTKKKTESHARHVETLKPIELQDVIESDLLFAPTSKAIIDHLKDREKKFDAKVKSDGPSFDRWINQLMEKNDFNQFKVELEKKEFFLSDRILNFEDFKKYIDDNPELKKTLQIKFFEDQPLHLNKMHLEHLREERKKNFDARVKSSGPSFDRWINQLMEKNSQDFNQFKVELEKKGFPLNESIGSFLGNKISNFEDFKNVMAKTPEFKEKLQIKFFEHLDTLSSVSKNTLKERLLANEKINHNFFSFKLTKSKVMFGVTVVAAVTGIALSIALIAGAVFPPNLFLIPTVIGLAATFGFMGLGLYHLHNNKPNLAGTIFRFVKANILLNQIPLIFSEWRLAKAKAEQNRIKDKINSLSERVLNDKAKQKKLDHYQSKGKEADEKVLFCQERYQMYFDKIKSLENEIVQARKDDFELNTGFESFTEKGPVKYSKVALNPTNEKPATYRVQAELEDKDLKDEFTIISDALIEGEFWKDREANAFLKKYGGVELANEVQLDPSKLGENSNFLSEKLRHVILRNSRELLAWLEKEENKGPVR